MSLILIDKTSLFGLEGGESTMKNKVKETCNGYFYFSVFKKHPCRTLYITIAFSFSVILTLGSYSSYSLAANSSDIHFSQKNSQPYIGAVEGRAFILEQKTQGIEVTHFKTSLPAFKTFGLSPDGNSLLYSPLKNGVPSGELYVENLNTGDARKISEHLIMNAAWAPTSGKKIAYTFSGGNSFGLAIFDLQNGQSRTLVSNNVLADFLQWDDPGKGIYYFESIDGFYHPRLSAKYISIETGLTKDVVESSLRAGFPALYQDTIPKQLPQLQIKKDGTGTSVMFPFHIPAPDGIHEVIGENLLGSSALHIRNIPSDTIIPIGEGQIRKVLPTGIVVRRFSEFNNSLEFVDWDGQSTTLGTTEKINYNSGDRSSFNAAIDSMTNFFFVSPAYAQTAQQTVSYNLPLALSILKQGGQGYPAPGNCNLVSHTGPGPELWFAYDFEGAIGAHVMAAADGLVVYTESSVTCNTIDTDCPDYDPNGCSGTYLGNVVIIQHADDTYTNYAHLEKFSIQVPVGSYVCQGMYIARQGHTGSTNGNYNGCGDHLHFHRQVSPDIFGISTAIDFSDVPSNPLSCGQVYTSASTEFSNSILPNRQSFGSVSGNGSISVTSPVGCNWLVTSNNPWILITSSDTGIGNDVVTYTVQDNSTSGIPRAGTITVAGQTFTVVQDGVGILNYAPVVDAGSDQTILPQADAVLSGTVTDDGLPNPPATVSTVWSQVSGPGTVSFINKFNLNTTARFSTNGVYVVRLTADDLDLSSSDDVTITVNSSGSGSLSGFSVTPVSPVDLTAEGDLDWAHWGLTTATDFNHKSGVSQQISNITLIGGGGVNRVKANPIGFNWTDGTPVASTTDTHGGVWKNGAGSGFQIVVPADTSDRTLRVYVGLWAAQGKLEATLSDGSAPAFTDTSLDNSSGTSVAVYTISYRAGSGGQSLTVKWTVQTAYNNYGNVTLEAATLDSMGGGPANQAPGVNAGADQTITLPSDANLIGTVNDDGLPNPPGAVTTIWSQVSGPGTVAFANAVSVNTTASFSAAGVYVLRLTADDSDLMSSDDVAITVNSGASGSLSGFSVTPVSPVDLTAEGDLDWAHWGLTTATDFNHKSGVSQQISNIIVIGGGGINRVNANPIGFNWTDGTPVTSTTDTHGGVWKNGAGSGFQIIVPADTSDRTLRVYVGLWAARGRFEATLSDGSAPAFIDTSLDNSTATSVAVYTISYRAGSGGQSLIVKWTVQTAYNSYGNVTLEAATLMSP